LTNKKNLGIAIIILGILSGVVFFAAGMSINNAGSNMTDLRSVSGDSVAEHYYQEMGEFVKGISLFSYGLGLAVTTFSIGIGGQMLLDNDVNAIKEKEINLNQLPKL
jgi:type II secretory pathway pseudopilin PulG